MKNFKYVKTFQQWAIVRVCAAHGWKPAYQGSCIDPSYLSHILDPTLGAPGPKSPSTFDY